MDIRSHKLTRRDIDEVATSLSLDATGITEKRTTRNGTTWSGRLNLAGPNTKKTPHTYGRISSNPYGGERCINAVCWHGFRDFFRGLYEKDPDAIIITAFARYEGRDDFEDTYPDSDRNIGSMVAPMYASEACHDPTH